MCFGRRNFDGENRDLSFITFSLTEHIKNTKNKLVILVFPFSFSKSNAVLEKKLNLYEYLFILKAFNFNEEANSRSKFTKKKKKKPIKKNEEAINEMHDWTKVLEEI